MSLRLSGLSSREERAVRAAYERLCAPQDPQATPLFVFSAQEGGAAEAMLAEVAAELPEARRIGDDLCATGQAIWLMREGTAEALRASLQRLALAHAPRLRLNALHAGPALPAPTQTHAAWPPHQTGLPAPLPAEERLALALDFLCATPSVTGQILHLTPFD